MPLISACQLPPPANWQDLEALCVDLWHEEWRTPDIQRHGRLGQSQDGVDVIARLASGEWAGIQCKCIPLDSVLREQDLLGDVAKAKDFQPPLSRYLVVTTGRKDVHLESICRRASEEQTRAGAFSVTLFSWADVCLTLQRHRFVARAHFPFVINAVEAIVLKNEGGNAGLGAGGLPYSFSRERFIHPRILEELLGFMCDPRETVVAVDLISANLSNRFYGDFQITPDADGAWVGYAGERSCPSERQPYFRYKHVGTSSSGIHLVRTMWGGGGTGHFNDLLFLTFHTDRGLTLDNGTLKTNDRLLLKTLGSIPIGDRYIGTITFTDGILSVGEDQNSFGCLKAGFSIRVD